MAGQKAGEQVTSMDFTSKEEEKIGPHGPEVFLRHEINVEQYSCCPEGRKKARVNRSHAEGGGTKAW